MMLGALTLCPRNAMKTHWCTALIMKDDNYQDFLAIHCVIHCGHLAAKCSKYDSVMKTVLEVVNFMCSCSGVR